MKFFEKFLTVLKVLVILHVLAAGGSIGPLKSLPNPWARLNYLIQPLFTHLPRSLNTNLPFVKCYLYTSSGDADAGQLLDPRDLPPSIFSDVHFDKQLPVIPHGLAENYRCKASQCIKDAYLNYKNGTVYPAVIICDYSAFTCAPPTPFLLSGACYPLAVGAIPYVAAGIATVIQSLVNYGVTKPSRVHMVGASLGAQVAGYTGALYRNLTGVPLGRCTGLDPAGPLFFNIDFPFRTLAPGACSKVDVVHTDPGALGISYRSGDTDYWVNWRTGQPGCPPTVSLRNLQNPVTDCGHLYALRYFIKSIAEGPSGTLGARPCSCFPLGPFRKKSKPECSDDGGRGQLMGEFYNSKPGDYCLNAEAPPDFCSGKNYGSC